MKRVILLTTFCFVLCSYVKKTAGTPFGIPDVSDPDVFRNVSQLITSKGYPLEEHSVLTADGYILSLQRIPHGRNGDSLSERKGPVLIVHGIFGDAANWVLNFPDQSLGYILPDAGYDVWLINTRGNTYSRKNIYYTTDDYRFWNFSFDESAQYDIPATIDYILDATKKEDLYLIAHSQGTTISFAMLSEFPEYNDKVKLFIALAPVTYSGHFRGIVPRIAAPIKYLIQIASDLTTAGEFFPNNKFTMDIRVFFCTIAPDLCESFFFVTGGKDRSQLNETRIDVYIGHFPASSSAKSLVHFLQMFVSKKYRKYDYKYHNFKHYHQKEPPEYDVSRITTPVAVFWSTNDKLGDTIDVGILRSKLNSLEFDYLVPYPYDHYDFLVAMNAAQLIYRPILDLLAQY